MGHLVGIVRMWRRISGREGKERNGRGIDGMANIGDALIFLFLFLIFGMGRERLVPSRRTQDTERLAHSNTKAIFVLHSPPRQKKTRHEKKIYI